MRAGSPDGSAANVDDGFAPLRVGLHAIPEDVLARLHDGSVSAATIFGRDDRTQITATTEGPWRTIAQLVIFDRWNEITSTCSGVMLNTNVVLTAAHCLFDPVTRTYIHSLLVVPGESGPEFPFGARAAIEFAVPQGWVNSGDVELDFGIALIDAAPFSSAVGPFLPVVSVPDSYFYDVATVIATAGYPGDKPPGTMWFTAGFFYFVDAGAIYTEMDAYPGQSGSPIYALNDRRKELFIVGVFSKESPLANLAVRFSAAHISALNNYCASLGCSFQSRVLTDSAPSTPTRTATSSPTATRTPSPTPTPTKTPTGQPTPSPTPGKPPRVVVPLVANDR